ncbi:MAG: COX15/CtaA family protein [Marinibacterium sp.]|nr:COX15/CtaA family protein [Marinibacterium sp.]
MSEKRSIFEEVSDADAPRPAAQPGMIDKDRGGARRAVRAWQIVLLILVVTMILVGGLTRLTDSGLSITEWHPITGAMPPTTEEAWQSEFEKYKAIDEFQLQNQWMQMEDFQVIYWWEWGHRQLGRVIGLVWAIGFFGLLALRKVPTGWTGRLALPGVLGGVQGAVGWWMVSSGVTQGEGMVDVASYRLAMHLGLAFAILALLAWNVFGLGSTERDLMQARRAREDKLFGLSTGLLHFAFLQILIGALVAGIDAGRSYTDWPLIGGQVFPPDASVLEPWWRNLFESPGLVQWIHRMAGYLLLIFAVIVWTRGRRSPNPRTRFSFNLAFVALLLQVVLGIVTVVYAAPLHIAIVHQLLAIGVWTAILNARFQAAYPRATSVRG